MIALKEGVRLDNLTPQMVLAAVVVEAALRDYSAVAVITSANDSKHSSGSLHYSGRALDFRTKSIPEYAKFSIIKSIKQALGPHFDVVFEDEGGNNEHLHIEHDPKYEVNENPVVV